MLLDSPTPADWLTTRLAGRFDEHGSSPSAGRWLRFDEILGDDAAVLREIHAGLVATDDLPPPAAATYVAGWIGGAIAAAVGDGLATADAGFIVDRSVRWHQHPDGWVDRVELDGVDVVVAPGHPWVGQLGVHVAASADEARTRSVAAMVELLTPIVDACHRLARVGKAGLWNEVADAFGMCVAFDVGLPTEREVVETLTAGLRTPGVPWKAKPTIRIVDTSTSSIYVGQKGGCCLAYTASREETAEAESEMDDERRAYLQRFPEPVEGPYYCTTCCFRDADDCEARQVYWHETRKSV